jgi:hypothetical protein
MRVLTSIILDVRASLATSRRARCEHRCNMTDPGSPFNRAPTLARFHAGELISRRGPVLLEGGHTHAPPDAEIQLCPSGLWGAPQA